MFATFLKVSLVGHLFFSLSFAQFAFANEGLGNDLIPNSQNADVTSMRVEFRGLGKSRLSNATVNLNISYRKKQSTVLFEGSGLLKGDYVLLKVTSCDLLSGKKAIPETKLESLGKQLISVSTEYGEISSEAKVESVKFGWGTANDLANDAFVVLLRSKNFYFILNCQKPLP